MINLTFCKQVLPFWWFPPFYTNCKILINLTFCTQISTFYAIPIILIKFQHFDWILLFYSSSKILIDSHFFPSYCKILINWIFCTQLLTFWSIPTFDQFQHFDPLDILHSNFNILIHSKLFTQIATYWWIWNFELKFQHFCWFLPFRSNYNILINLTFCKISSFAILTDSHLFTQIAKIWINLIFWTQIPTF